MCCVVSLVPLSSQKEVFVITDAARLTPAPGAVALTKSGCCANQNEGRGTSEGHFWLIDETAPLPETSDWGPRVTTKLSCRQTDIFTWVWNAKCWPPLGQGQLQVVFAAGTSWRCLKTATVDVCKCMSKACRCLRKHCGSMPLQVPLATQVRTAGNDSSYPGEQL